LDARQIIFEGAKTMIVSKEIEQRQQWLNSLQIGDEVAVDYGRNYGYKIGKITRITPTRRFTVEGKGCTFGNDGVEMGRRDVWGGRSRMRQVTDQIREDIARSDALFHLRDFKFDRLSTQQLHDILKIIQGDTTK
jgi:hypothetical protein